MRQPSIIGRDGSLSLGRHTTLAPFSLVWTLTVPLLKAHPHPLQKNTLALSPCVFQCTGNAYVVLLALSPSG